jgi:hypothetical protein
LRIKIACNYVVDCVYFDIGLICIFDKKSGRGFCFPWKSIKLIFNCFFVHQSLPQRPVHIRVKKLKSVLYWVTLRKFNVFAIYRWHFAFLDCLTSKCISRKIIGLPRKRPVGQNNFWTYFSKFCNYHPKITRRLLRDFHCLIHK